MSEIVQAVFLIPISIALLGVLVFVFFCPGILFLAFGSLIPVVNSKIESVGGIKRYCIEGWLIKCLLALGLLVYLFSTKKWTDQTLAWLTIPREIIYIFPAVYITEPILFVFKSNPVSKFGGYIVHLYFR